MKGLEPEIQRLIAKHKGEIKKIKQIHEAELLESDERAAQKYVRMTEELRDQLADEKEAACGREREMAKQRYSLQGTKIFQYCNCLGGCVTYNFTCPANTCTCPLKGYAIKNIRE